VINVVTFVTVIALLLYLYWPLGLVVLVGAIPLFLISKRFTDRYNEMARKMQDEQGDVATLVEETAGGMRVIKAFGRRDEMAGQFDERARRLHDTAVRKARMVASTWPRFDLVPNVTLALVLVGGAVAVSAKHISLGELIAFVTLQLMLIWPIDALGWIIANGQEAMTAADRVYEVLDTEPTIVDKPGAVPLVRQDVRGALRFDGVGFAYPGASGPILHRIDLEVRPGETLAIVGATGSGKTTLVSLVPRLIDVTAGRIMLDGRDIRDTTIDSLRSVVGVAFEEATLFSMSVRENLTLGRPDATDEEIDQAIVMAQRSYPWFAQIVALAQIALGFLQQPARVQVTTAEQQVGVQRCLAGIDMQPVGQPEQRAVLAGLAEIEDIAGMDDDLADACAAGLQRGVVG